MKFSAKKGSVLAGIMILSILLSGWAAAPKKPPVLGLTPIKESAAYRQFLNRPQGEFSKVIFLIERFKTLPFEIIYDGRNYRIKDVAGIIGAFVRFNYKKDRLAKDWILQYANRSFGTNALILVRFADGSTYPAGEILLQELQNLENTISEKTLLQMNLPEELQVRIEGNSMAPDAPLPLPASK